MKHTKFIRAMAAVVACACFISAGFLAAESFRRADKINGLVFQSDGGGSVDFVYVQNSEDATQNKIELSLESSAGKGENFFDDYTKDYDEDDHEGKAVNLIAPGFTREGDVKLTNKINGNDASNARTMEVYLFARPVTDENVYEDFLYRNGNALIYLDPDIRGDNVVDNTTHPNKESIKEKYFQPQYYALPDANDLATLSQELTAASTLKITLGSDTVYDGKLNGESDTVPSKYAATTGTSEEAGTVVTEISDGTMTGANRIHLGTLDPGQSLTFHFSLSVPTTLGNTYHSSIIMIDWVFYGTVLTVEGAEAPSATTTKAPTTTTKISDETQPTTTTTKPEVTTTTTETVILAPPEEFTPGTGEESIYYMTAAVAACIAGFTMLFIAIGPRRKKQEED